MPDTIDLGGGGGNAFGFDEVGAAVTGQIVSLDEVQQTDMQTNEPVFWANGQPKMMFRAVLATQLRDPVDPADDGYRSVYLRGSRKPESESSLAAVLAAVKNATGGSNVQVGGTLTLKYVGDGVATQRGFNPPKRYAAMYSAPTVNLAGAPAIAQQPVTDPWAGAPQWAQPPTAPPAQRPIVASQPILPAPPAPVDNSAEIAAAAAKLGITPEQLAALAAQAQPVG